MKRLVLGAITLWGAALLGGCPVYSNGRYCNGDGCFDCPANSTPSDGTCVQWTCSTSNDCPQGYTCDANGSCVAGSTNDSGDCATAGCSPGYVCRLAGGHAACVASGAPADAGSSAIDEGAPQADASPEAWSEASASNEASAQDASPSAADTGSASALACNADSDCTALGGGARCIDGACAAQADLCSDTSQCVAAGSACVDGVCVPHCNASSPCPAGYACDFTLGVCDINPSPCGGEAECSGGSVCVEGRCAAPCASGEASSACPSGQLCVNGGCIPDEAAHFECKNDGQSGALANRCPSDTSICLHHDCYEGCDPDGGACSDPSAACAQVTVTAGTYAVCAPASTLGSECDPATGADCAQGVCVDGYCR